ncbi:MAG: IS66 family transposase [bacterium]|nr:IS66 family transposase [bacterium]
MAARSKASAATKRGKVLDVLRTLLDDERDEDVVSLVSQLVARNEELELLLGQVRERKNRSERLSRDQLDLFLDQLRDESDEALADANEKLADTSKENRGRPKKDPTKQPPVRRPPPPGLRRVENTIVVPDEERPCPICGAERKCIGHETTPVIELVPAEVIVREDKRELLACKACDAELVRAPIGDKVIAGGYYGPQLVASLIIGKFWDSLPLNRMRQQLERLGLSMPSSSMGDQIGWATELLRPLWLYLMVQTLDATVMHLDATSLPVKDRDSAKGIVLGSLWGYVGDKTSAVFLYCRTGKAKGQVEGELGPADILARRIGFVCADAAGIFDSSMLRDEVIEVGCNMHARRYFIKALDAGDQRAAVPLDAFKTLYDVEATVRDDSVDERLQQRRQRGKPVYEELLAWCRTYQPLEPPGTKLAAALRYLLNHHLALMRYLDDGRLPIDNQIVERLHRRPAVGRRNYLFAGSHRGAERAAIAYSIMATCHINGVNPQEYLPEVLARLARGVVIAHDIPQLTPAAWKARRASSAE